MVGRNAKDTVAVIGRGALQPRTTVDSVAAAHRELNIKPVGDLWPQEGLFYRLRSLQLREKGRAHPLFHRPGCIRITTR